MEPITNAAADELAVMSRIDTIITNRLQVQEARLLDEVHDLQKAGIDDVLRKIIANAMAKQDVLMRAISDTMNERLAEWKVEIMAEIHQIVAIERYRPKRRATIQHSDGSESVVTQEVVDDGDDGMEAFDMLHGR